MGLSFWSALCLSAQKHCFTLNLCFVCWLLVWKNKTFGKRIASNTHVLSLHGVTKWISPSYPCQLIVSYSFYCSTTVTAQYCLEDWCDHFVEYISTWISLYWYALCLSAQKICLYSNICFVYWLLKVDCTWSSDLSKPTRFIKNNFKIFHPFVHSLPLRWHNYIHQCIKYTLVIPSLRP